MSKSKERLWREFIEVGAKEKTYANSRLFLNGFGDPRLAGLKNKDRQKLRTLIQVLTGAAPLKGFINKIKPTEDPSCRYCRLGKEDVIHLFIHCTSPLVLNARKDSMGHGCLEEAALKDLSPQDILTFCKLINFNGMTSRSIEEAEESDQNLGTD